MDDVIILLAMSYGTDAAGNTVETITASRQVFCKARSVTRSEFYQAAQAGLHPDYVFVLSHYKDYQGEKALLFTDWTGHQARYEVVRVYRGAGDELEITAEEKIGHGN